MATYAVLAWEITDTTEQTRQAIIDRLHKAVPRPPFGKELASCVTIAMGDAEFRDLGVKLQQIATDYWIHFAYRAFLADDTVPSLPLP